MATVGITPEDGGKQNTEKPLFQYNKYATKKTLAKGLLDISLLMANASQLKAMLNAGSNVDYFWVVVVLISLSLILQLTVGGMLLVLGSMETKSPEVKRHVNGLNNAAVGLICVITVVNIFIAAFGIKISD
ncbi:ninjurin-1-like [Mytilus trossulus]|uniref:ninjurin-1-like n=1 Tax=Mytilus trossulus TaxID=6551 RepID=UPI0030041566